MPAVALIDRHADPVKAAALLVLHFAEFAPVEEARMRVERVEHPQHRAAGQPLFIRSDGVIVFNEPDRFDKIAHGRIVGHRIAGFGKDRRVVAESADPRRDGDDQKRDQRDCGSRIADCGLKLEHRPQSYTIRTAQPTGFPTSNPARRGFRQTRIR